MNKKFPLRKGGLNSEMTSLPATILPLRTLAANNPIITGTEAPKAFIV